MKYILTERQLTLIEDLELKSRANDQEKQREEYVNQILSKGFENLTGNDLEILGKFNPTKTEEILKQICDNLKEFEPEIKKYDLISYYFYKIYFNNIKPKKYEDLSVKKSLWVKSKSAISYDDSNFYFFEYWTSNNVKHNQRVIDTKTFEFKTLKELIKYIKENNEPEIQ